MKRKDHKENLDYKLRYQRIQYAKAKKLGLPSWLCTELRGSCDARIKEKAEEFNRMEGAYASCLKDDQGVE